MKTPHENIETIRRLIIAYYDGSISQADLDFLNDFFTSADRRDLPSDIADEMELFLLFGKGVKQSLNDVPEDLNIRINALTIGKITKHSRRIVLYNFLRPMAAAAVVAIVVSIAMWQMRHGPADVILEPTPTIFVKLASQSDDSAISMPETPSEDIGSIVNVAKVKKSDLAMTPESTNDNYIEITNRDQASILTQDAMALVREKLAVAGFSISSASEGLRHIDNTIHDIIAN